MDENDSCSVRWKSPKWEPTLAVRGRTDTLWYIHVRGFSAIQTKKLRYAGSKSKKNSVDPFL